MQYYAQKNIILNIILIFQWKVILSKSEEKYAQTKHHLKAKTLILVDFYERGQQGMELFIGRSINMIYGQIFWSEAMVYS